MSSKRLFIGLDLGQQYDYTVITAISSHRTSNRGIRHVLEYVYRFPVKMSYSVMTNYVTKFVMTPKAIVFNPVLIVDYTGVGAPVYDMLVKNGLKPVAFTITGGSKPNVTNRNKMSVPKRDMVASLQIALQNHILSIPSSLKELGQLKSEIQNFHMKIDKNSSTTFGALRDSIHDDITMSLCMAIWYADYTLIGKKSPFIKVGN